MILKHWTTKTWKRKIYIYCRMECGMRFVWHDGIVLVSPSSILVFRQFPSFWSLSLCSTSCQIYVEMIKSFQLIPFIGCQVVYVVVPSLRGSICQSSLEILEEERTPDGLIIYMLAWWPSPPKHLLYSFCFP